MWEEAASFEVVSDHFTLRLPSATAERLSARSKRIGMAKRTLAQRYLDEALRHDDHPLVHFVGGHTGRRATLVGTGLDVWEVVATVLDNGGDVEESAEYLSVPAGIVQAAVSYYGEFKEEIDAEIAFNDEEWERGRAAWEAGRQAVQ